MSDRGRQATVAVTDRREESERALEDGGGRARAAIDFSPCRARTSGEGREGRGWVAVAVGGDGEPAKQSMRWWRMWLRYSVEDREWRPQHKEGDFERN